MSKKIIKDNYTYIYTYNYKYTYKYPSVFDRKSNIDAPVDDEAIRKTKSELTNASLTEKENKD